MADINRDRQRDAAGIGPYAQDAERLVRLSDLGSWDVAEGEPDIRGWEVRTIGGRELGKVKELLVDPDAGEVVMMDVDLTASDRHAMVPLRIVEIDRARRLVRMDSSDLTGEERAAVPEAGAERKTADERSWSDAGRVKYASRGDDEVVVQRRPVVEEVVVRRRVVDGGEAGMETETPISRAEERIDRDD
jgi:hypothetical protein